MSPSFSAKILLFGEYTVIHGGQALALPYPAYSGQWVEKGAPAHDWAPLLRFLFAHPELEIDLARLQRDLAQGGGFVSSIPQGKGLGSSGALVAALLHSYGPRRDWQLCEVRERLASLEACYHGQSSGVDPLVSWVGQPLLLGGGKGPEVADMPLARWRELERWFLLDSGVPRHSAPLIALFKQQAEDPAFQEVLGKLNGLVNEAIESYEHLDEPMMGVTMQALSAMQLKALDGMIPSGIKELWGEGLKSRQFALKLCGAGGGGFFIGYRLKTFPNGVLKF